MEKNKKEKLDNVVESSHDDHQHGKDDTHHKKNKEHVEKAGLQEELTKALQENQELKNQYFKAYADAENYKKRMQKELDNALKYRIQSFALEVLPALDNLERALAQETSDQPFKEGVVMIYNQIKASLEKEGVQEIEALNQVFDHNVHQAIMTEKQDGVEPGHVIEVLQKGYLLKDRILRPALVKVSE